MAKQGEHLSATELHGNWRAAQRGTVAAREAAATAKKAVLAAQRADVAAIEMHDAAKAAVQAADRMHGAATFARKAAMEAADITGQTAIDATGDLVRADHDVETAISEEQAARRAFEAAKATESARSN